jgi:hypothetical protein
VFEAVLDGKWRTIAENAPIAGCPETSASAQLRHLRNPRFGSHIIERRHVGRGLSEYRYGGREDQ